ncbi:MAG: BatA domain-containing protein [Planctomycetota bacterium]
MSFTQLLFLLGSAAVIGPLIAHLLAKPRYRRLPFTMLHFLRFGQIESQSRRRFRDLLMLLLRCAIIVLIAMLFARPRLITEPKMERTGPAYYLGLDDSMSMAYADGSATYFDRMVDSAVDYIRSADDRGLFNIYALASQEWSRDLSKELALTKVRELKIVPDSADVAKFLSALDKAKRQEHPKTPVSVLVLSDFTPKVLRQFVDVSEPAVVDSVDCKPIVSPEPINNAAVIDAHVARIVDDELVINATLANYGQVDQKRQLTAKIGNNESAPVDVELSAYQRGVYTVRASVVPTGAELQFLPVELRLSATDGLKEDDTFYLAVSMPQQKGVNLLLLGRARGETFLLKTAAKALSRMDSYDPINIREIPYNALEVSDLRSADVLVCSTITAELGLMARQLKSFLEAGGKAVFFLTDKPVQLAAEELWKHGILPAMPGRCIRQPAYIQPKTSVNRSLGIDSDPLAARSLANYRLDKIVLTGYFECEPHSESICALRLQNGLGFVYFKRLGSGTAILVNTSADDSLGALTKSAASVAFCRYLLGQNIQIGEHSFFCDQQVMLLASDMELKLTEGKHPWVRTCDGLKNRAALTGSFLLVPEPGGIGWVRTLAKPVRYAGVNLARGETDMAKPTVQKVANVVDRAFLQQARRTVARAEVLSDKEYEPIWKIFAWVLIVMLLLEPAVANRLKR